MSSSSFTYIIVGGGIAGVSCVEQILEYEQQSTTDISIPKILLISSSSVVKEARNVTRLTKTLEDFVVVESSLKSFKDVHQGVTVIQDSVVGVETDKHIVRTASGQEFGYRKLCICSGGRPNVVFSSSSYVIGIRDAESVQDLAKRISKARRVIVLGNGGIATEFVYEVDGIDIFWVIKDKSISATFVDPGAAEFLIQSRLKLKGDEIDRKKAKLGTEVSKRLQYELSQSSQGLASTKKEGVAESGSALGPDWHRHVPLQGLQDKKNVNIIYETECTEVIEKAAGAGGEDWPVQAKLTSGQVLGADIIISATGVKPNCSWMKGICEVDEEKGILVDFAMLTSVPDIFAAGDVCYPKWTWAKHWFQMRLWTQARHMGLYAGKSMFLSNLRDLEGRIDDRTEVDLDFCFEIFSHVTRFFGFKVVLLGLYNGQGLLHNPSRLQYLVRCTKGLEYIKVLLEDGKMQGAILIGDTGLEETFENLILNQVDLTPYGEDLLNPDIDIEDYFD